jgi:hypothetical protein
VAHGRIPAPAPSSIFRSTSVGRMAYIAHRPLTVLGGVPIRFW